MACLLCEKYGITESSYKDMVRNGVISTTFPAHENIYIHYKRCLSETGKKSEAIYKVMADLNVSQALVYRIISEIE